MHHRAYGALTVLLLAGCASAQTSDHVVEFLGAYTWTMPGEALFGGFSGIEVDADGTHFLALSDRTTIVKGRIVRQNGRIVAVEGGSVETLRDAQGIPLEGEFSDSEGLATDASGQSYISFEGKHRIEKLIDGNRVQKVPTPREFEQLQVNSGIEALAYDPEGRLIAIPERSGALDRPFPVYRQDADGWSIPYTLPRRGEYLPVGADTGPDGRLYLLERRFAGILGFASRVRSFAFGPAGLTDERLIIESRLGEYDNLEGISAWRDEDGAIRLTMISDDNFFFLQSTQFVEFRIIGHVSG